MRLLTVSEHDELSLVERFGNEIEPYAILSHTWGKDSDEVSFRDLVEGTYKTKEGFRKLEFCRKQIVHDNLKYFWVDTCCIDKSSSAELTEAINSMYRWYQRAAVCYVYLPDVAISGSVGNEAQLSQHWQQQFRNSRWFKRGWTLQELIAPKFVQFFDSRGEQIGDKTSLVQELLGATKLPLEALRGQVLEEFSVDVRLSWAEGRETKREEDAVYSLLGIFDIYMPLIYGEGRQRAFRRLMKELQDLKSSELPSNPLQPITRSLQQSPNPVSLVSHGSSSAFEAMPTLERYDRVSRDLQTGVIPIVPMWPGNIIRTRYSGLYLERRDMLSNAAYSGRWIEVLELLEIATEEYGENWSNVVRLSTEPTYPSAIGLV
jgi:hypothetical protein